jgi:hypothetical protein
MEIYQKFKKPHELEFISQINRDGSGVSKIDESFLQALETNTLMRDELYVLNSLSVTNETYIAHNSFDAYVVKLKK